MKKVFKMLVVLLLLYFGIQIIFSLFGKGHEIEYSVDDVKIKEIYTNNQKNEHNNYYFDVDVSGVHYFLQTYHNFGTEKKVIKKVKQLNTENNMCILPIFKNDEIVMDVICKVNGINVYYHDIIGNDAKLDNLVSQINEYDKTKWANKAENLVEYKPVTLYKNNMLSGYMIGINSYRGIYTISEKNVNGIIEVPIFNNDIYVRKISGTIKNTYITAAYDMNYTFNKFYTLKLDSKKVESINTNHEISFNSYVQGIIGNSMYIFDKDNKVQYEINIKSETVTIVGNVSMGIKYYNNGSWETKSAYDAANYEILFITSVNDYENNAYVKIDKVGNEKSGFYYLYKRDGNGYNVYKANIQNKDELTYLFYTNKIDNIYYFDDTIFYTYNNEVRYYNDELGVRTLFVNTEFEFNNSLMYSVYKKD